MTRFMRLSFALIAAFCWRTPIHSQEKPLRPYERVLAGEDAARAEQLQSQADAAEGAEQYAEAAEFREQLFQIRTQVQGADHWETISERWTVELLRKLAALEPEKRAQWRATLEKRIAAGALRNQGKWAQAEQSQREHLQWCREELGDEHPYTARVFNMVANTLKDDRRYADADELFRLALTMNLKTLGESHLETARCYTDLGSNLDGAGKFVEAEALLQKAIDIYLEIVGEPHPHTIFAQRELAFNLHSQGKIAQALSVYQRLLDVQLDQLGENHTDTAWAYHDLAVTLTGQGKPAEAYPLAKRASELFVALRGESHLDTAAAYQGLASNLDSQGKRSEAEVLYRKALAIRAERLGDQHLDTAASRLSLALHLLDNEDWTAAGPLIESALESYVAYHGDSHPGTAGCYGALAAVRFREGNLSESERLFQKALKLEVELLGEYHPSTVPVYRSLGVILAAQGRLADALEPLRQAAAAYEMARLVIADRGMDRSEFGIAASPYRVLAGHYAQTGSPRDAWLAAERDLARGVNDQALSRRGVELSATERRQEMELSSQWNSRQPRIQRLVSRPTLTGAEQQELLELKTERRSIELQLVKLAAGLSERQIASLEEVQSAMGADAALVFWTDVTSQSHGQASADERVQEHWGCVVRHLGDPAWVRLPGGSGDAEDARWTREDSSIAGKLREALGETDADPNEIRRLTDVLYSQRIAPLERHLEGVQRLYIVAVHEMAGIPVEVLTDRYTISYVPSGSFLVNLKSAAPPQGSSLLALGDPVFLRADEAPAPPEQLPPGGLLITAVVPHGAAAKNGLRPRDVLLTYGGEKLDSVNGLRDAIQGAAKAKEVAITVWRGGLGQPLRRTVSPGALGIVVDPEPAPRALVKLRKAKEMALATRGGDWDELPGTRIEVLEISKLFGGDVEKLLDSAANERVLDEMRRNGALSKYRYVHLATHGKANRERAMESVLILSLDDLPENPRPRFGEPLLDGHLSANEVLEFWNLNADLVSLSACETGLGRQGGGDGLLGFAQAFLLAGSRAVCVSLWKVDDAATSLLMTRFYQNLLGQRSGLSRPMGKAAALAEAKRWLRTLSAPEALKLYAAASDGVVRSRGKVKLTEPIVELRDRASQDPRPFSHPRYWSAFILIGDPD